ncbi:somatostatin receptor type 5-like [Paramacrobiotus metropolitanus]|uniref:somatostatin receptor type 5-like n=1 Tax=Paramacrobiotus metropolitanus TaxID=2943436 RepID=UPI00244631B4|nr:somatostatin receptor type 5-like [Paramacrobiotus metropolitanus]
MIIAGLGTILFILLIMVIIRGRFYRTGCGALILHEILLETSVVAIHIPLNILNIHSGHRGFFTPRDCAGIHFPFITTLMITNWAQFSLALNRFVATLYPHMYWRWVTKTAIAAQIAAVWVFGLVLTAPPLFGVVGTYGLDKTWNNCAILLHTVGPYPKIVGTLGVYLPTGLLMVLYLIMFIRLQCCSPQRVQNNQMRSDRQGQFDRRVKMAKLLCGISLWYNACYHPQNILSILRVPMYEQSVAGLQLWLRTVYLCGYVMTPMFFFSLNKDYQTGLLEIIRLRVHGR